jgi:hypothetical protein
VKKQGMTVETINSKLFKVLYINRKHIRMSMTCKKIEKIKYKCNILLTISYILLQVSEMGVVRIDDKLLKEVQGWLNKNGNRYKHPTISAFVNNAVYEKLQESKKEGKHGKE